MPSLNKIYSNRVGVKAAKAAKMKVVAVPSRGEAECSSLADKVLHSLLEFQPELWGLPPFEDCMNLFIFLVLYLINSLYFINSFLHDNFRGR